MAYGRKKKQILNDLQILISTRMFVCFGDNVIFWQVWKLLNPNVSQNVLNTVNILTFTWLNLHIVSSLLVKKRKRTKRNRITAFGNANSTFTQQFDVVQKDFISEPTALVYTHHVISERRAVNIKSNSLITSKNSTAWQLHSWIHTVFLGCYYVTIFPRVCFSHKCGTN